MESRRNVTIIKNQDWDIDLESSVLKRALSGEASAQFELAYAMLCELNAQEYHTEKRNERLEKTAVAWLTKAAEQGHLNAMSSLGQWYCMHSQQKEEGERLLNVAAKSGCKAAHIALSQLYSLGIGFPKSDYLSYVHSLIVARLSTDAKMSPNAMVYKDTEKAGLKLTRTQRIKAQNRANEHYYSFCFKISATE